MSHRNASGLVSRQDVLDSSKKLRQEKSIHGQIIRMRFNILLQLAKGIIDAAAATIDTLDRFVLSTLSEARKWSNGTIKWVLHFDAKAEAVDYLRSTYPDLLAKTSFLHMGYYATNWKAFNGMLKKQDDGSFVVSAPMSGDKKIPMGDAAADTGTYSVFFEEKKDIVVKLTVLSQRSFHESARPIACRYQSVRRRLVHFVQRMVRDLWSSAQCQVRV